MTSAARARRLHRPEGTFGHDAGQQVMRAGRPSVAAEVVRSIQDHLAARKLRTGDKLPAERVLSEQLGVSRTSVRDALKRLEALGIIEVRIGRGTYVRQTQYPALQGSVVLGPHVPRAELLRVLEARAAVDVAVVCIAAARATAKDLRTIADYLAGSAEGPIGAQRRNAPDLRFEALIGEACHNPYLQRMQEYAHAAFMRVWDCIGFIPRSAEERHAQHVQILRALQSRNVPAARRAMEEHLDINQKIKLPRA